MLEDHRLRASTCALMALAALVAVAVELDGAPTVYPTGVTIHDPSKAYQGYNLYIDPNRNKPYGQIVLTDMSGNLVHSWVSPVAGFDKPHVVEPLPSGNILAIFGIYNQAGTSVLVELDWAGTPVWQWAPPGSAWVHHDVERLPNGNTLVLMAKPGVFPEIGPNPMADAVLMELNTDGRPVWDWSTANHWGQLPLTKAERKAMRSANADGKAIVFHANSLAALPPNPFAAQDPRFTPGNILTSQRDTNLVLLIDRNTGQIVWSTKNTIGQHQVEMIEPSLPGAGNLLLLDNGGASYYSSLARLWSQVLELDPPSKGTVWQYKATKSNLREDAFFGRAGGGAQRLPNGNTLITEGPWGRAFEVTTSGTIVWEFVIGSGPFYRFTRVAPDWPPFAPLPAR